MVKLNVLKSGVVSNSGKFSTEQLALAWFESEKAKGSFGKPERWVSEDRLQIEGEDINQSIEMIVEPVLGQEVKLYKFASEFTHEIVDITAEVAQETAIAQRKLKRAFGEQMIDKISTMNETKALTTAQIDAFMENALIISLREHLWAGNIPTFVEKLQSSDVSAFFTTQEKNAVILECQTFLTSLGA